MPAASENSQVYFLTGGGRDCILEASLPTRLRNSANYLESFLAGHPVLTLAIFTVLYVPYVCARALLKPLWFDELATLLVARMDSISQIMAALGSGVDAHPPVSYVLIHWSSALPFNELISARVPSMFGFWLMCVCIYLFAARRGARIWALMALIFPFLTGLFFYATEARPYGLVLGFSALALLAWQYAPGSRYRALWLIVLSLSLAAAICTHYYAVLVPISLFCGEAVRTWRKKAVRWEWVAIGAPYAVLVDLRPMISAQTSRLGVHWAQPSYEAVLEFYSTALDPAVISLAAAVLAVAIYEFIRRDPETQAEESLPFEELAAAFAFAAIPIIAYVVAVLYTHSYTGRYSIAGLVGMSLVFWWVAQRFSRASLERALIAVLVLYAVVGIDELRTVRRASRTNITRLLGDFYPFPFDGDLPIVVQDGRDYLEMVHYAPPELARRIYYLADAGQSMRLEGSLGVDVALLDLKKWVPLQVEDYRPFIAQHDRFLLFWGKPEEFALIGWQMTKMIEDGAKLELVRQHGNRLLFAVDMTGKRAP